MQCDLKQTGDIDFAEFQEMVRTHPNILLAVMGDVQGEFGATALDGKKK